MALDAVLACSCASRNNDAGTTIRRCLRCRPPVVIEGVGDVSASDCEPDVEGTWLPSCCSLCANSLSRSPSSACLLDSAVLIVATGLGERSGGNVQFSSSLACDDAPEAVALLRVDLRERVGEAKCGVAIGSR